MTNIVYLPRTTIQVDPDRADITRMQTKLENAKLRYRLKKKEMMHKMSGGTIKKNEANEVKFIKDSPFFRLNSSIVVPF